jgi:hypothetical protein
MAWVAEDPHQYSHTERFPPVTRPPANELTKAHPLRDALGSQPYGKKSYQCMNFPPKPNVVTMCNDDVTAVMHPRAHNRCLSRAASSSRS